jgi:hypothetical protein
VRGGVEREGEREAKVSIPRWAGCKREERASVTGKERNIASFLRENEESQRQREGREVGRGGGRAVGREGGREREEGLHSLPALERAGWVAGWLGGWVAGWLGEM